MPQYKVPQNIDLADKIVGPLTLLQFAYLLVGGMIAFGIFKTGNLIIFILIGAPIALLSLALAFVKVQNMPFGNFLLNMIWFTLSPKARVWRHSQSSQPTQIKTDDQKNASQQVVERKILNKKNLFEISKKLDR
ncbi:MAG: Uncharacterized protein CEN89_43 [Candidatus Berkelbacteria bacterium Licking1014_7]|uniref:PrgI family protein n=1 Tax=Candidatus Berkelbacteria bacterium Licking1014_7 TaxID=2017147 RepID=A0A554LKW3_9BACT|nr:MAG: Uncharacterized protein CEN89_43 [Candidatus Berkelbacteria bacterium Licking1014_7]